MSMFRLRMTALLLATIAFSYLAIPSIVKAMPDEAVKKVSAYIKGEIRFMGDRIETDKGDKVDKVEADISNTTHYDKSEATTISQTTAIPNTTSPSQSISQTQSDMKVVEAVNLSRYEITDVPRLFLMNETDYKVDLDEFAAKTYAFEDISTALPSVLVIHTHGTEGYLPDGVDTYDDDTEYRSTDSELNVVGIGNVFCKTLESYGIGTLHDVTMYDKDDPNNAYAYSRNAVKNYLSQYPSIKYVVDIHRDSVFNDKGENKKPIVYIDGEATAQVMLVIGTDEAGASHDTWRDNLTLGAKLQEKFNCFPTFARPIYLRSASFNQQLSDGAFLLEVGSCGNTVTEARRAAVLAAKQFAILIKQ